MDEKSLQELLQAVKSGATPVAEALARLRTLPYTDLGFARVDHHRALRTGMGEVIFCEHKTAEQVRDIFVKLALEGGPVMATRATVAQAREVCSAYPQAVHYQQARVIALPGPAPPAGAGRLLVLAAGTADLPVAEEAAVCAAIMGHNVERLYDVGIAGLHRLLAHAPTLHRAQVLIVVAGMEGALPGVVAGLVRQPVIGVPTSVGYGSGSGGRAALLSMLNTCAAGVAVMNIDNGFGAAALAHRIFTGLEASATGPGAS